MNLPTIAPWQLRYLSVRVYFGYCPECGKAFAKRRTKNKVYCSIACYGVVRSRVYRGPAHPNYKGRVKAGDYWRIYEPGHPLAHLDGYVLEHRKVLFDAGVEVMAAQHVHHLNHDKGDNRLENLAVMTRAEHMAHHLEVGVPIRNQYGVSTVASPEECRERVQVQNAKKPAGWWRKYRPP